MNARLQRLGENLGEVSAIKGSAKLSSAQTDAFAQGCLISYEIKCQAPDDGEIVCGVAVADCGRVLAPNDVENPM